MPKTITGSKMYKRNPGKGKNKGNEMEIKTKRLILRSIRIGDEKEVHEYAGDKDITMMFWLPKDTFEETVDFVKRNA